MIIKNIRIKDEIENQKESISLIVKIKYILKMDVKIFFLYVYCEIFGDLGRNNIYYLVFIYLYYLNIFYLNVVFL